MLAAVGAGLGLASLGALQLPAETAQTQRASASEPREEIRREMLQLKGTWSSMQQLESTVNGVPQKPISFKLIWSIDRDMITTSDDEGFAAHTYRFTVDPEKLPKAIDFTILNTGLKLQGIYKLDGENLTVCFSPGDRPKDLEAQPDAYQIRAVFNRASRTPAPLAQEYSNDAGCYWAVEPKGALPASLYSNGVDLIIKSDPQGAWWWSWHSLRSSRAIRPSSSFGRSPLTNIERGTCRLSFKVARAGRDRSSGPIWS